MVHLKPNTSWCWFKYLLYRFLVPGHTYGPTDHHFFANIEKHADTIEIVYTVSARF